MKKFISFIVIFSIIFYYFVITFNSNIVSATSVVQTFSTDINKIDENKYPGIKDRINSLKAKYPNWNFKIFYTGLDWNSVIQNEYVGHRFISKKFSI